MTFFYNIYYIMRRQFGTSRLVIIRQFPGRFAPIFIIIDNLFQFVICLGIIALRYIHFRVLRCKFINSGHGFIVGFISCFFVGINGYVYRLGGFCNFFRRKRNKDRLNTLAHIIIGKNIIDRHAVISYIVFLYIFRLFLQQFLFFFIMCCFHPCYLLQTLGFC